MFMAPCNRTPRTERVIPAMLLAVLLMACGLPALATQADRKQPIKVSAQHTRGSLETGVVSLAGQVTITQGTLKATADKGVAHTNEAGETTHIELTGDPAHLQQRTDDGDLMRAHADRIEYQVNGDNITLLGNAFVSQPGQGSFRGAELVYNPTTGAIEGSGGADGLIHMTLQPRDAGDD